MDEILKKELDNLVERMTDEQKEKVKACKNVGEVIQLSGEWGIELTDELASIVSGGMQLVPYPQPK